MKTLTAIALTLVLSTIATGQSFKPRLGQDRSYQSGSSTRSQQRSILLKIVVDDRSAVGTSHQWMQALAEVGADRVVAESGKKTRPSFEEYGSGASKTLSIVGIVSQGKLYLPGGKFTIRQTSAIRDHLKKLRDDGAEVVVAEKIAFGLTAKQLVSVHDQLGAKIETSTVGQNVGSLASLLIKQSNYPLSIDLSTKVTMQNAKSTVEVEFEGYSIGTALAFSLRQMGLVFEPVRPQGEEIQLLVRPGDVDTKNWPVGWPVSESRKKAAPTLFVKVDVQAQQTPILDLLGAIESRIDIPFFYDLAKISAHGVNLEETKIDYLRPGKKSSYDRVIDKCLNQCDPKLKAELRIDEAGKRFLWITTRK